MVCTLLLNAAVATATSDEFLNAGRATNIDFILENAIAQNLIYGGVVVIGNHEEILYCVARGNISTEASSEPLSEYTAFDIASLTKVIATAPAIMVLLETGVISLNDPISRWFPEFKLSGRDEITILHLLTHTSGLDDSALAGNSNITTVIQKAAAEKHWKTPGGNFLYADTNFILLAELVQRITGTKLDRFCYDHLYKQLGMSDTTFLPKAERLPNIAPTRVSSTHFLKGVVQDENARQLGGVAGHAGLFSSAFDISQFARMMLCKGVIDGKRIFQEQTIAQMTAPHYANKGNVIRGLGWDIKSSYSSPKGSFFSAGSFGHTGYSGSSIWIDPEQDIFVILLTNRVDFSDKRHFNKLRNNISTLASAVFAKQGQSVQLY